MTLRLDRIDGTSHYGVDALAVDPPAHGLRRLVPYNPRVFGSGSGQEGRLRVDGSPGGWIGNFVTLRAKSRKIKSGLSSYAAETQRSLASLAAVMVKALDRAVDRPVEAALIPGEY